MDKQFVKSQVAMEFMILAGVSVLIFLIMAVLIADQIDNTNNQEKIIRAEDLTISIQKELNLAVRMLDGYKRTFYIPKKIGAFDYNITVVNNELVIKAENHYSWARVPEFTGSIDKGANTINKKGGVIYLN